MSGVIWPAKFLFFSRSGCRPLLSSVACRYFYFIHINLKNQAPK
nr:MAG TPA: hypothetical protein [Bacteriophage sp.]